MLRMPAEPMLARPVEHFALPAGWAAEPKWDGYRALLAYDHDAGQVLLRSRHGTDLTTAFPELTAAAAALPYDSAVDGFSRLAYTEHLPAEKAATTLPRPHPHQVGTATGPDLTRRGTPAR